MAPLNSGTSFGARVLRRHPVVCRSGIVLLMRADECQVLGARDVVGRASMEVTTRKFLLVQLNQFPRFETLSNELAAFLLRTVAIHDAVGLRYRADFFDPLTYGLKLI